LAINENFSAKVNKEKYFSESTIGGIFFREKVATAKAILRALRKTKQRNAK